MFPSPKVEISIRTPDTCNLMSTCENAWSYLQICCKSRYRMNTCRAAVPVLHQGILLHSQAAPYQGCIGACRWQGAHTEDGRQIGTGVEARTQLVHWASQ
jgi:hypothetical protein